MQPQQPTPPPAPNLPQSYQQGLDVYLSNLGHVLGEEGIYRNLLDPQRIAEQQGLQSEFGPTQYAQQLQALGQIDPTGTALRTQLGGSIAANLANPQNQALYNQLRGNVSGDLAAGTSLTPDQAAQLEQQTRRSQAARGNTFGQAPVEQEAFTKGQAGQALYQQRLGNASNFFNVTNPTIQAQQQALNFQNSATPESQINQIAPVSADRSMAYVNPNAGFQGEQFALQNYQNQLAATQTGQQTNPWGSVLGSVGSLAGGIIGNVYGGPVGGYAGSTLGGISGNYLGSAFSDERIKTDIEPVGKLMGQTIVKHGYRGMSHLGKHLGVIAQDVKKTRPDAVTTDPASGLMRVDYKKLGLPLPMPLGA